MTQTLEENKDTVVTISLALYIGMYLFVGIGGISFNAQPALGSYHSNPIEVNITEPGTFEGVMWRMFQHDEANSGFTWADAPANIEEESSAIFSASSSFHGSPVVVNESVYIGDTSGSLYQLNAVNLSKTEGRRTTALGGDIRSTPVVAGDFVYVGAKNGLHKLNASNIEDSDVYAANPDLGEIRSSPTVSFGSLYVGNQTGYFFEVDTSDLSVENRVFLGDVFPSSPAVAEGAGYIYVGAGNTLYQMDENLQVENTFDAGDSVDSSPTVVSDAIFVGSDDNTLYRLNASNVSQEEASFDAEGAIVSSPAFGSPYVYVGSADADSSNGYLYQLWASNLSEANQVSVGDTIRSSPAVTQDSVFVGSNDNTIYQFDADDVSQIAAEMTGDMVWSSPAVARGSMYVGSFDNNVYQFGNIKPPWAPYNPSPENRSEARTGPGGTVELSANFSDAEESTGNLSFFNASDDSRIGWCTALNGSSCEVEWGNRSDGETYGWYAEASDGLFTTRGPLWRFQTEGNLPKLIYDSPEDGATLGSNDVWLNITLDDAENDDLNVTFFNVSGSGREVLKRVENSEHPYNDAESFMWSNLPEGRTYEWFVNVTENASDPDASVEGEVQSFEVQILPEVSCNSCHEGDDVRNEGDEITFTPDEIDDDSDYRLEICGDDDCSNANMLCSTEFGEPTSCTTTIDSGWRQSQEYWVRARDVHGNAKKVEGDVLTILKESFSIARDEVEITLQTSATIPISVTNKQNRPFTFTLTAEPTVDNDGRLNVYFGQGRTSGLSTTFEVRPGATANVLSTIGAALCDGVCNGEVIFTLTNQQTGRERQQVVDVTVNTLEGVSAPGMKLAQLIFVVLAAAGLFFYFRE